MATDGFVVEEIVEGTGLFDADIWIGRIGLSTPQLLFTEAAVQKFLEQGPSLRRVWKLSIAIGPEVELVQERSYLRTKE